MSLAKHWADNLPDWNQFQTMVQGIWDRAYYTNHGPLLSELEARLSSSLNVEHTVCMTNSSIALMIAIKALDIKYKVVIPAFAHPSIAQSVTWSGLDFEICKVKENSLVIDTDELQRISDLNEALVIAINDYGYVNDIKTLEALAKKNNFRLLFISSSFFGEQYEHRSFGTFGHMELFSFHESHLVHGADGASVCTHDTVLAEKLRNIRSSYGARKNVPIPYTGNGRMSEIQAGLIHLSLDDFKANKRQFEKRKVLFKDIVAGMAGITISETNTGCKNFLLMVDFEKLGINKDSVRPRLKEINRDIDFFDFYGHGVQKGKNLNNSCSLADNALGIPAAINEEQFGQVISILTKP